MRFIIINFICLLLLTIGCTRNQQQNPGQGYTPAEDEQGTTLTDDAMNIDQARTPDGDEQGATPVNDAMADAYKHYSAFFSLSPTDPDAAHAELSKYVTLRFGSHPLADEWLKLVYRLNRDRKGTFRDVQRYVEGHLQMLTDIDPEKRTEQDAKHLELRQNNLKQLKAYSKIIEKQGDNMDTFEMEFNLK